MATRQLGAPPTLALHAATKEYADAHGGGSGGSSGGDAGLATAGSPKAPLAWGDPVTLITTAAMNAASGKTTRYWPFVVDTKGLVAGAPGRFLMYWSTDHDGTTGGIFCAWADDPLGPWTPISGAVFVDSVAGNQTETPTVLLRDDGTLIMYYQQAGAGLGTQSTLYATSSNGTTWVRGGFAMQKPSSGLPNDGHTGYARVYKFGLRWLAYTLFSGTDYSRQAMWYSSDGVKWILDRRLWVNNVDQTGQNDLRVSYNPPLFYYRNALWGLVNIKTRSSGGAGAAVNRYYFARMSEDMRRFIGEWVLTTFAPNCVIEFNGALYGFVLSGAGVIVRKLEA